MKYFTREMYDWMQVVGYFGSTDTQEDWEYLYDVCYSKDVGKTKQLIVDEIFKGKIDTKDIVISRSMPKEVLKAISDNYDSFKYEWESRCAACKKYQDSIKMYFPEEIIRFLEKTIHDVRLHEIKEKEDIIELIVEGGLDFEEFDVGERFVIRFLGVKEAEVPRIIGGETCLYEEYDISNLGVFEYRILMINHEFKVIADRVEIEIYS